jgi:hypothetical protein
VIGKLKTYLSQLSRRTRTIAAWVAIDVFIVIGVWLIGIRVGPITFGQTNGAEVTSLREIIGYLMCSAAAVIMWVLIIRHEFRTQRTNNGLKRGS